LYKYLSLLPLGYLQDLEAPMLEFSLPDLSSREVMLQPEIRTVKGAEKTTAIAAERLRGRLTLGIPVAVRLTPKTVASYPEATAFLSHEKGFGFYLIHLACTFHHKDSEPFEEAWVQVKLRRQDNLVEPPVIAWSLVPQKEEDTEELSQSVKLDATLKFVLGNVKGTTDVVQKATFRHTFLSAFGLQESEPYWYFRRLETRDIEGTFRLALIVRSPVGSSASGAVEVEAQVQRTSFGVFKYKSPIDQLPAKLSFVLE
jgi:hypothetical protein